jgi:peptidyl-tRNA hydrolase
MDASDFVLSKFKRGEQKQMADAVTRAAEGAELWIQLGIGRAMNRINAASTAQVGD